MTDIHDTLTQLATVLSRQWLTPSHAAAEAARESIEDALEQLFKAARPPEEIRIPNDPRPYSSPPMRERLSEMRAARATLKRTEADLKEAHREIREAETALGLLIELVDSGLATTPKREA